MSFLDKIWYTKLGVKNAAIVVPLLPLSMLFSYLSKRRREAYSSGKKEKLRVQIPVVVVGGISVGGTGKTPACISIIEKLSSLGYSVGLLSRGYKGKAEHYPLTVQTTTKVTQSGDEPLLIKMCVKDKAVVVVDPNRERGAKYLEHLGVDVIVTDDGLQHYALERDIEIIVLDGKRMLGNGFLLPAGPLREGRWRLDTTDFIIVNGNCEEYNLNYSSMKLVPSQAISVNSFCSLTENHEYLQAGQKVIALAGIGNPNRFYSTVEECGYEIVDCIKTGDHGHVSVDELKKQSLRYPILMTAKDAVKYSQFKLDNLYVLNVEAKLPDMFYEKLSEKLDDLTSKDL